MAKVKRLPKVSSFRDLYEKAKEDPRYQALCIAGAENLGWMDHPSESKYLPNKEKWARAHYWLSQTYVGALVGEYGESEDKAFREVLAEVNHVRDCI